MRLILTRSAIFLLLLLPDVCTAQTKGTIAPLPDASLLLLKVQANQKHIDELRKDYLCKETDDSAELDKNGIAKKHDITEYELSWRGPNEVRRTISKNGKPLTPEELKKEDERIEKLLKKEEKKESEDKDESNIGIQTFLRASSFQNMRREEYKGRTVLTIDVFPNPQFKPTTQAETIVHLLAGTLWIDEDAAQVVRLEAHLDKSYKMAGGMAASIHEGSGALLEQQRINDEVWMPSLCDVNIQGRALLFVGVHVHIIQHFSEYRKFRTDTRILSVEPVPPTTE